MSRRLPRHDCRALSAVQRCGFTLIEMVAVITLVSLVMTSVAVTISSLHRVNTKLRDEFPASAAMAALGMHLRTDAHAARQAALATGDNGEALLRLTGTDQHFVEYSAKQQRVSRIVRLGDHIERRDTFSLSRGSELEWSVHTAAIPLVTLIIRSHVGRTPGAVDDVRVTTIVSAIGLDHTNR